MIPDEKREPVSVTVEYWDRLWVADALRNEARKIREEYAGRRGKTQVGKHGLSRADRLWTMAQRIEP